MSTTSRTRTSFSILKFLLESCLKKCLIIILSELVKRGKVKPARTRVPKEMINDKLRTALTKQGYTLVGSHSGVKICRWTKSQLRGRGGCYKHSFYGIESHRYETKY